MTDNCSRRRVARWMTVAGFALAAGAAHAASMDRTGKEIVEAQCASCHARGMKGAPRIGDRQAWTPLAARGLTGLTASAIQGVRQMPAHGGDLKLSDVEVERAIVYMVNQSGTPWIEPVNPARPAGERAAELVVQEQCAQCHAAGRNGAPKIGDRAAWIPRLNTGLDNTVRSAINGHGGMPPRGGKANLTDAEIRAAIVYMFNPPAKR